MKVGCVVVYGKKDIFESFAELRKNGFDNCQLICWDIENDYTDKEAEKINNAKAEYGIEITTLWAGWSGPKIWDFYDGQETLGLLPTAYRAMRVEELIKGAEFATKIGVNSITTHAGFIPENPHSADYHGLISALKAVAQRAKELGIEFRFESGQETPITLLRAIQDIGTDNLGINLDPANLIVYGKANPCDALMTIGKYVKGVHAKDGKYPTDGKFLGEETPLGEGLVNFQRLIPLLKEYGYDGPLTIEREIEGEQQIVDILKGKKLLEQIIASC